MFSMLTTIAWLMLGFHLPVSNGCRKTGAVNTLHLWLNFKLQTNGSPERQIQRHAAVFEIHPAGFILNQIRLLSNLFLAEKNHTSKMIVTQIVASVNFIIPQQPHTAQTCQCCRLKVWYQLSFSSPLHLKQLTIHLPLHPDLIFPFLLPVSTGYIRGSESDGGWGVRRGTAPFKRQESTSLPPPKRQQKSDPVLDQYQCTLNHRGRDSLICLPVYCKWLHCERSNPPGLISSPPQSHHFPLGHSVWEGRMIWFLRFSAVGDGRKTNSARQKGPTPAARVQIRSK